MSALVAGERTNSRYEGCHGIMVQLQRLTAFVLILLISIAFHRGLAEAASCGDDVGGERVACACGDVVVSDTRLRSTDPVVRGACPADGLTLRAAGDVESLTLDLAGLQLTGKGRGTGILVSDGGRQGAILIGGRDGQPGQIAGFRVGVSAQGSRGILAAENLVVLANETDGLRVRGRGASLRGIVTDANGRSGVRAHGRDHSLDDVSATSNGRYDLRVSGNGHLVVTDPATLDKGTARVTGDTNVVLPSSEAAR